MKIYNNVQSTVRPQPFQVNPYKIILTQDIEEREIQNEMSEETTIMFFYTQIEYDKDEYIEELKKQNEELNSEITDLQLALCEIYESGGST